MNTYDHPRPIDAYLVTSFHSAGAIQHTILNVKLVNFWNIADTCTHTHLKVTKVGPRDTLVVAAKL